MREMKPDPLSESSERLPVDGLIKNISDAITILIEKRQASRQRSDSDEDLFYSSAIAKLGRLITEIYELSSPDHQKLSIDLDDENFRATTRREAEYFISACFLEGDESPNHLIAHGEIEATEVVLWLLRPSDLTGDNAAEHHFTPWRRDIIEQLDYPAAKLDNGHLEVYRPTKIPSIWLALTYNTDQYGFPRRELRSTPTPL